jgi:hypothetical protein
MTAEVGNGPGVLLDGDLGEQRNLSKLARSRRKHDHACSESALSLLPGTTACDSPLSLPLGAARVYGRALSAGTSAWLVTKST